MNAHELLTEPIGFLAPARALEALSPDLADRRLDGAPHSIAEIVAHLNFWQNWFIRRAEGTAEPMVQHAAEGWPAVTAGSWPSLQQQFVDGLSQLTAWADAAGDALETPLTPAIEFPPLAHYTKRDVLVHVATHNAHHLGQVILLRQLLGAWPPPAGSWTW
jgi:uncharacterized damage-inducible protein DinB